MFSEIPFAMLISGGGSTATAIWNAKRKGELPNINFRLVISSRPDAKGIERLVDAGFDQHDIKVVDSKSQRVPGAFGETLETVFRLRDITHFGQYGWLPYTPYNVCENFYGINQHPGPIDPTHGQEYGFGGRGMHGRAVHAAVLAYARTVKMAWTEATAHRVTNIVDGGELLGYRVVDIFEKDDVDTLAARVLPEEHLLQIRVLQQLGQGGLTPKTRGTLIVRNPTEKQILAECKSFAAKIFPNG